MIEQAFLQNILEQPDDDAVRLIYADWLLERGDTASTARGEFIQAQVRLARSESTLADWNEWADLVAQLPRLREREKALLERHGEEWARPLPPLVKQYTFRRGFVESVALATSTFIDHGAWLFRQAPIQHVRFAVADRPMTQLAACVFLSRLRTVDLSGIYFGGNPGLSALLSSSHLTRLRTLVLKKTYLGDAGLRALAESPVLARLAHLDLSNTQITVAGVRSLLTSPYWGALHRLNLEGNRHISPADREALAATLEGRSHEGGLATALGLFASPRSPFRNAHARCLARQAARDPAHTAAVLTGGLSASYRRVRAAAAQMLGRLGPHALPALPGLVRCLGERSGQTRGSVVAGCAATTLLNLLPALPREMQGWLATLANPLRLPEVNLRATLEGPHLPQGVWEEFAALCVRRLAWHARVRGRSTASMPKPPAYPDHAGLSDMVQGILEQPHRDKAAKEASWLVARLCELLLKHQREHPPT